MRYDREAFAAGEDGTRLFYGVCGDGPAIFLLDGLGCDGYAWAYLLPRLARDHRVVHIHHRGHGRSGAPRDVSRLDVPELARDALAVARAESIESAVWIGHSLGTQIALEAYRADPASVAGLVLLCGSSGKLTEHFHGNDLLQRILPTVTELVQRHRGVSRALWGRVPPRLAFRVAAWSREVDKIAMREEDFARYWEHVSLMDPDVFLALLASAGGHSADDMLSSVRAPTLVIAAEKDTFTPAALAERLAQRVPGAKYILIRGGSHALPVEQPVLIEDHIRDFLAAELLELPTAASEAPASHEKATRSTDVAPAPSDAADASRATAPITTSRAG